MSRLITKAEIKALNALHLWLHQGNENDSDLIFECEDFHEERKATCGTLKGLEGVEWVDE